MNLHKILKNKGLSASNLYDMLLAKKLISNYKKSVLLTSNYKPIMTTDGKKIETRR